VTSAEPPKSPNLGDVGSFFFFDSPPPLTARISGNFFFFLLLYAMKQGSEPSSHVLYSHLFSS
jgi:hypothetical protein